MSRAATRRLDWNSIKDRLRAAQAVHVQSSTADESRLLEIFRRRAARLAVESKRDRSAAATAPVLVVSVDDETYGIELRCIAQVFPDRRITPVPGAPETLLGVANLQGEVRPIFGLRRLLALPPAAGSSDTFILLLRQEERLVGLQVGCIDGIRHVRREELHEQAAAAGDQHVVLTAAGTDEKVIMLRTSRLFEF